MRLSRHTIAKWLLITAVSVVCLAQNPSIEPSSAAKVIQLVGQVSVLKDSSPWALHTGDMIQVQQLVVTGPDGYAQFQVSDGSTFEVFPNARVTFRSNYSNWKDLLDVWIGRVKVHIEKLNGQPNHNKVHTPTAVISVRGTIFDVDVDDSESTLVSVEEGQVDVRHRILNYTEPKIINPGEYIRVYKNQPLAQKSVDRGEALHRGLRAAAEAFYQLIYRMPGSAAGSGAPGAGGGAPTGDTKKPDPPPPPTSAPSGGTAAPAPTAPPPPAAPGH